MLRTHLAISTVLSAFFLAIFLSSTVWANDTLSKENKLKAAYFLNFIEFIEWPNDSEDSSSVPLDICLQATTPFVVFFRALVSESPTTDADRQLHIYHLPDATHCDYTYLYRTAVDKNSPAEGSVVVISSSKILQKNAAIIFYESDRKLRFEIDLDNIKKAGVTVSSELLKLAKIKQSRI
jgi:hypothetical protein